MWPFTRLHVAAGSWEQPACLENQALPPCPLDTGTPAIEAKRNSLLLKSLRRAKPVSKLLDTGTPDGGPNHLFTKDMLRCSRAALENQAAHPSP
jgi:hypothetical protein